MENCRIQIRIINQFHEKEFDLGFILAFKIRKRSRFPFSEDPRKRNVTMALKAYAALTTSAARGAVRAVRSKRG
jgi:hypothetical protein